ncbi:MAG: hypothetical protein IB618_01605 [Candidatus Pacearchaeota archaeon]|nr:MAG: hypothetical protein IB618_01605 [Candidatus Pacearchaeota archaeon]
MEKYKVMLVKLGDKDLLNRKSLVGFIFEPKFDGIRVLIYKEGNDIELVNRKGRDIIFKYPELLEIPRNINCKDCVLDAVLTILNKEGKPNHSSLQYREQLNHPLAINSKSRTVPATLFVFDILEKDDQTLVNKSLGERKRILGEIITNSPFISLASHTTNGKELWKQIQERELSGMIAKELSSIYEQGKRSWSWLNIQNINTTNTLIVGSTKNEEEKHFDSLILASYVPEKGEIIYVGTLKQGFNKKIKKKLKKLKTDKPALSEEERNKIKEEVTWIKPELIVEVKYQEMTKDKQLKEPSFIRLKFDKKPGDCLLLS